MSKRFLLTGLAVVLLAALLIGLVQLGMEWDFARRASRTLTDQDISRMLTEKYGPTTNGPVSVERLDLKQQVRLAIGGIGLVSAEESQRVSELVLAELTDAKGLELVERQALDKALRELSMSAAGLVRAQDAVRVGKLVRADWFLLGSPLRLSGTNFVVVRIVDARTGILRQASVFAGDQSPVRLAADLAEFVRRSRQDAAEGKSTICLSVGGFADLSVNSRQAMFPIELRSYLVAAYQKANVTMLEREFTDALLKEVYLDLAGLTDESGKGGAAMQAAYWMVDGQYQSYETSTLEVELELNVRRMFGRNKQIFLRDKPGEPMFRRVKETIDSVMQQDIAALTPTRFTEVQARLEDGKELARLGNPTLGGMGEIGLTHVQVYQDRDEQAAARQRRNVEEAMRAFQTVLLLSPTNREAKMYLAACLRNPSIRRDREARDIYRELLDEKVQDKWVEQAQQALVWSFKWLTSAEEKARWFAVACQQGSNSPSAEFYCKNAEKAAEDVALKRGEGEALVPLAEKRLREAVQSTKDFMEGKGGTSYGSYGMSGFRAALKGDEAAAALALAHFLPTLESEFPELAPHLAAEALDFQTVTNTPLVAEYFKQMEWCLERPREVFEGKKFWDSSRFSAYNWFMRRRLFEAAVRLMEGYHLAAARKDAVGLQVEERDRIALAYAYMGVERWKDALGIFESFTNRSVTIGGAGPWGRAFAAVLTGQQADWCREKLGKAVKRDPVEQELAKQILCLHAPSDFLMTEDGLWVATEDSLLNLSFELATNLVVKLPGTVTVTCLATGGGKIWVGTDGNGLIEFDRSSKRCRSLTEADGLLMDYISSLLWTENQLWIGYGRNAGGGLGSLDLKTEKLTAYMHSLLATSATVSTQAEPPRGDRGKHLFGTTRDALDAGARGTWRAAVSRCGGSMGHLPHQMGGGIRLFCHGRQPNLRRCVCRADGDRTRIQNQRRVGCELGE